MDHDNNKPDVLLDHNYDGIQEYDNPLPNWWLMTFFGTIIFGFIYFLHYSLGGGPNLSQELIADMKDLKLTQSQSHVAAVGTEDLAKLFADSGNIEKGKTIYAAKCLACHGAEGQGMVGPNLTDNFWLHGQGKPADLIAVVTEGVPEKGMLAWGNSLSREEIVQVSSFVTSLKGTKPANPKSPQGTEYK